MFIAVFVTVPNLKVAKSISKKILAKRLCACVSIVKGLQSFFWWQGKIDSARELLLIIKTRKSLFKKLAKQVSLVHPYQVPEIVALPIDSLSKSYAVWLKEETTGCG